MMMHLVTAMTTAPVAQWRESLFPEQKAIGSTPSTSLARTTSLGFFSIVCFYFF